jgi:hypothetical protein
LRQLLRHAGDPEVPALLVPALVSSDTTVARQARQALISSVAAEQAVPSLAAALAGPASRLANAARGALLSIGALKAVPVLVRSLGAGDATIESGSRQALLWPEWPKVSLPALVAAVASGSPGARPAAELLGTLPLALTVPCQAAALMDPDPQVMRAAHEALEVIAPDRVIPLLAREVGGASPQAARGAEHYLRKLESAAEVDVLVDLVLDDAGSAHLLPLLAEAGYRHSSEGRHFLYLVLTGRFDEYLAADFELRRLRQEYRAASPGLQQRIRETITRAGDLRMNGLFIAERKATTLGALTMKEAELLVDINARNRNWDKLFGLFDVLPARAIDRAVRAMRAAGWRPESEDGAVLFDRLAGIVAEIGEDPQAAAIGVTMSPVMRAWLERGESGGAGRLSPSEARSKLDDDTKYSDRITAMAVLKKAGQLGEAELAQGARSDHWLVRLATAILGGPPPALEPGGRLWLARLAPALHDDAAATGKPCQITRDGLEALQAGLLRFPDPRKAGGLRLLEAVASHHRGHDIEIDENAHVTVGEDTIEIDA